MEKKYKITKKKSHVNHDEEIARIRRTIKEDFEEKAGTGMLAYCLVFLYELNDKGIGKISELQDGLISHYKKDFSRDRIRYGLSRLYSLELVNMMTGTELLAGRWEELNEQERYGQAIFRKFIDSLPRHMKNNYGGTRYYYVNKKGEELIPWCCKLLGFNAEGNGDSEEKDA